MFFGVDLRTSPPVLTSPLTVIAVASNGTDPLSLQHTHTETSSTSIFHPGGDNQIMNQLIRETVILPTHLDFFTSCSFILVFFFLFCMAKGCHTIWVAVILSESCGCCQKKEALLAPYLFLP